MRVSDLKGQLLGAVILALSVAQAGFASAQHAEKAKSITDTSQVAFINSVGFSPDGSIIVSGSHDQTVKLWDAKNGNLLRSIQGHTGRINSVALSPDGSTIIAGTSAKAVKQWEVGSGNVVQVFVDHLSEVLSVGFSLNGTQIAPASSDGAIRLWDARPASKRATDNPHLVTLIGGRQGDQWLSMTQEGFFVAGHGGSEIATIVRGSVVIRIPQIDQSLFNPSLVGEKLAGDPARKTRDAARVVNLVRVLDSGPAPTVSFEPAQSHINSSTELVFLDARVVGVNGNRVEWRVNGQNVGISILPGEASTYKVSHAVALEAGVNVIEVVAFTKGNLLASLPARAVINYSGVPQRPNLHILAIGINAYIDKGWEPAGSGQLVRFSKLTLAVNDATAFAEAIKRAGSELYAGVRVTLMLDADASKIGIEEAVVRIAQEVDPRDTFILFIAGHGVSEHGRFFIIPQDYQGGVDSLRRNAIGQDFFQDWFANRIRAKRALILLDTCESGSLVEGYAKSQLNESTQEAWVGRLHDATGRPVLTAAAEGHPAWEGYEKHGVFTWAALDALKNADRNHNSLIELSELVAHVQDEVPRISAKLFGRGQAVVAGRGISGDRQSARFGSHGEDFPLVSRLD